MLANSFCPLLAVMLFANSSNVFANSTYIFANETKYAEFANAMVLFANERVEFANAHLLRFLVLQMQRVCKQRQRVCKLAATQPTRFASSNHLQTSLDELIGSTRFVILLQVQPRQLTLMNCDDLIEKSE